MSVSTAPPARLGLITLLLLSVFAWAPTLYPGYWQGLEGFVPVFNAAQPAPIANVATGADLWRGAGSATFLVTPPLIALGLPPTTAVRLTFALGFLLGGIGLYAWLRARLGDLAAGLAGLIYLLQPIFLATVYVRGSLPDALVLAWLPLAFAGLAAYAGRRSLPGAAVVVIAVVALWRTQAGLALLATGLLLIYALLVERHWVAAVIVAVAAAAAVVTLVPVWAQTAVTPVVFADHFVDLYQLFGVGWQTAPSVESWQDGYPFQLGFVAIGFSIAALWGWWRMAPYTLADDTRRLLGFAFAGALLLILFCLPALALPWQITHADRLLTYPWQVLLLAAPLLAVAAGALPVLLPDLRAPAYWSALVAVTLLSSYAYLTADFTQVQPPTRPVAMLGNNQLAVLETTLVEGSAPRTANLKVIWQPLQSLGADYNVFFQAITGEGTDEQVVAKLDVQPLGAARPPTSWRPGEILTATYTLDLAPAPVGAPLRYHFGYYDWRDGTRLPVNGGLDDKLVLHGQP